LPLQQYLHASFPLKKALPITQSAPHTICARICKRASLRAATAALAERELAWTRGGGETETAAAASSKQQQQHSHCFHWKTAARVGQTMTVCPSHFITCRVQQKTKPFSVSLEFLLRPSVPVQQPRSFFGSNLYAKQTNFAGKGA
jgi:hypothetical protein